MVDNLLQLGKVLLKDKYKYPQGRGLALPGSFLKDVTRCSKIGSRRFWRCKRSSRKWGIHFDVARKEEKIAELEYKMGEPTFWDDAEEAQKVNQELAATKGSVDK